ncbi:hypothetical protein ABT030_31900 [Streptomyces mirabilis]|uniref:hypothetical protein n=1 Tax=Streptomyces mirabilis TaxID=68239 RepID=UPI0033343405
MTHDGTTAHIDLGQALRGHRFAHRAPTTGAATVGDARTADLWLYPDNTPGRSMSDVNSAQL